MSTIKFEVPEDDSKFWDDPQSQKSLAGVRSWNLSGAKATKQDELVMATNTGSITSKRSVERLYYTDEPHFFRFFVKKFQRRTPLINRGYFLRMHVVDTLVRDFLRSPGKVVEETPAEPATTARTKRKVVVNLGCRSDVLPWQCLTRYPDHCGDVFFIDVDFPDLMREKRRIVLETPELRGAFADWESVDEVEGDGSPAQLLLRADRYAQIGCDLRMIEGLRAVIERVVGDISACSFFFVAEVALTYMETEGADGVIEWASSFGDAKFCHIEQILPDGRNHPFAKTMLSHFERHNTPLRSMGTMKLAGYGCLHGQAYRFSTRGWKSVTARTLWDVWADDAFLTPAKRMKLNEVEPFDEWEEFALFGSHYCVVQASTESVEEEEDDDNSRPLLTDLAVYEKSVTCRYHDCPRQKGERRLGAAMAFNSVLGDRIVVNVMGVGSNNRLQSCDVFASPSAPDDEPVFNGSGPSSRACHTITDLGSKGFLLAGGRGSPLNPLKDCWLFHPGSRAWTRTHDLPCALFRHSVTRVGDSSLTLLIGGKNGSVTFPGCLLYHPEKGWIDCEIKGEHLVPVSGAILAYLGKEGKDGAFYRGLFGCGLREDGVISDQILIWDLEFSNLEKPTIRFTSWKGLPDSHEGRNSRRLIARYGASCLVRSKQPGQCQQVIIIGGVIAKGILRHDSEILSFSVRLKTGALFSVHRHLRGPELVPRPLLLGHSTVWATDQEHFLVVGGGATCYSMGSYWNKGAYTFTLPKRACIEQADSLWELRQTVQIPLALAIGHSQPQQDQRLERPRIQPVQRQKLASAEEFTKVMHASQPVVFEGLDIGQCLSQWTLEGLEAKMGKDRKVIVHESDTPKMDFTTKNFRYVTMTFGELVGRIRQGGKLYLRALSEDGPSEKPTVLGEDFPGLADDFVLPDELAFVRENLFSSVLRVSGPVNMWLHYDVMANVYCQISGSKRMLLFPPSDVENFSFAPGASSSSTDVFSALDSASLSRTHSYEVILSPGDVLFLPPLWLHTATPTADHSIAVNVFFRDLDAGYSAGRDVYGNRDLAAYEKGRQEVAKIAGPFQKLPAQAREFYILRLADELRRSM